MTFPNIQADTLNKFIVYCGVSLLVVSGYIYSNNLNTVEILFSESRLQQENKQDIMSKLNFIEKKQRKIMAETDLLDVVSKNKKENIKKIIRAYIDTTKNVRPSYSFILGLEKQKNREELLDDLLVRNEVLIISLGDSLDLVQASLLRISASLDHIEAKSKRLNKSNNMYLFLALYSIFLMLSGYIGWRVYDKRNSKLTDLQIKIQELTIKKMEKELGI